MLPLDEICFSNFANTLQPCFFSFAFKKITADEILHQDLVVFFATFGPCLDIWILVRDFSSILSLRFGFF